MNSEIRAELARLWAFRSQSEHEARARFAWLAPRLEAHGAPPATVRAAARAVEDEGRHGADCERLARRFGHVGAARRAIALPRWGPAELSDRQRTIYTAITMGCVIESMNVALLGETLRVAEDEPIRQLTREIMRDEVNHARIGWSYLAVVAEDAAFIAPMLPRILDAAAGEELRAEGAESIAAPAYGLLGLAQLRGLFDETLRAVVLPGLAAHGIDVTAAERWRRAA